MWRDAINKGPKALEKLRAFAQVEAQSIANSRFPLPGMPAGWLPPLASWSFSAAGFHHWCCLLMSVTVNRAMVHIGKCQKQSDGMGNFFLFFSYFLIVSQRRQNVRAVLPWPVHPFQGVLGPWGPEGGGLEGSGGIIIN